MIPQAFLTCPVTHRPVTWEEYYTWVYIDFSKKIPTITQNPMKTLHIEYFSDRYNNILKNVIRYDAIAGYPKFSKMLQEILGNNV